MPPAKPDPKRQGPDGEVLPAYDRPEMPWEREATIGRSGTAMISEFTATMALFVGLGWWLDRQFATKPWLVLVGAALGLTVGIYRLAVGGARALEREDKAK